jgi:hypothetical protein
MTAVRTVVWALTALALLAAGCGGEARPADGGPTEASLDGGGAEAEVGPELDAGHDTPGDGAADDGDREIPPDDGDHDGAADDGATADAHADTGCADCWRSVLYPADWTPGIPADEARFLHDFSYAGYRGGATPLPAPPPGPVFDVADFGADAAGATDSTAAVQAAIDAAAAAGGGVVRLPAGTFRCDGVLAVRADRIVLQGAGADRTRLYFSGPGAVPAGSHLTFAGAVVRGPDIPLAADGENRARRVRVTDAAGLAVGDQVALGWTITDDFAAEHGMTGVWTVFLGQWQPIFRRRVVALDTGATSPEVELDVPLRYPALVRDGASLRVESGYLREVGLEALALSNAVSRAEAWSFDQVAVVRLFEVQDAWIRDVASFQSPVAQPGFHLQSSGFVIEDSARVTVADCRLERAQHRGGGGNGYLYELRRSNEVLVRDSVGLDGRHNFIQNWGFGTTGCVFLRCASRGSRAFGGDWDPIGLPAFCEYHHSLAMANLVDSCTLDDGWFGGNRGTESTGAGQTTTQNVYWNVVGGGTLQSWAYGWGYVIGPADTLTVRTGPAAFGSGGTDPEDWVERGPAGAVLDPPSLYEDQLARRLAP